MHTNILHIINNIAKRLYNHTFDNDYGNINVNTTNNLMDYTPNAEHLAKWQWEIIRYPALFTDPFGGDEEGEYTSTAFLVKDIIYNILCAKKNNVTKINISIYCQSAYNKRLEQQNPGVFWNSDLPYNKYFGDFEVSLIPAGSNSKLYLDISKIKINNNIVTIGDETDYKLKITVRKNYIPSSLDAEKLVEYLETGKNEITDEIEKLLIHMDGVDNIETPMRKLPDCYFSEISVSRRIDYIKKLVTNSNKNINYITSIVNTIQENDIETFFNELGKTNIFYLMRNNYSFNDYTSFIKYLTLLYYKQSGLKEKLKNIAYDKLFVIQNRDEEIGTSIKNLFNAKEKSLVIEGKVNVLYRDPNSLNPYLLHTKNFTAYSYSVGYCDLLGLELNSNFGHLQTDAFDDIIPLPAFYFHWIAINEQREAELTSIDVLVTLASLAVGIGELQVVSKVGQFIFYLKAAGIIKSSVDLILLNQKIRNYIGNIGVNDEGQNFISYWETFSLLFDLTTFDLNAVDSNKGFFESFSLSWNVYRDIFDKQAYGEIFNDIDILMSEINQQIEN
jgi:hypothetical protein